MRDIACFYKFVRRFIVWDREVIIRSIGAPDVDKVGIVPRFLLVQLYRYNCNFFASIDVVLGIEFKFSKYGEEIKIESL